jgi:polyferredoxin
MKRCSGKDVSARGEVSLPVLATEHDPSGPVRRSRSGPRRAIVLATVQFLIVVHVAVWLLSRKYGWFGGYTPTPIEPSESIEFATKGVVNAGLIFFIVALLSTLILGRWFCGWGCHVVLLQDLCGWMMKKAGIRPKPFRSRLLVYVPLIMALYMFVWPVFWRLGWLPFDEWLFNTFGAGHWLLELERGFAWWCGFQVGGEPVAWKAQLHLTTQDFWRTFAPWYIAIPFLFICSFGAVYFLGAKGYCTYGCPYGGFFTPVDRLAPMRIRVTDDCEHCGHCTAVCTSNVRVHEEVREYGMVVDPGCMKCLDCVSVCPNDALYAGMGRPSVARGAPKKAKPKRRYDMSWPEDIAFSAIFAVTFVSTRGVYGVIPFLMAAGIAGCITFMTWKLWRLFRDKNVSLHRFKLKQKGAVRPGGWIYAVLVVGVLLLTAQSGLVRGSFAMGMRHARKVNFSVDAVLAGVPTPAETKEHAGRALSRFERARPIGEGGSGLIGGSWQPVIDEHRISMHLARNEIAEAEQVLRQMIDRDGETPGRLDLLIQILTATNRVPEAYPVTVRWREQWPDDLLAMQRQVGVLFMLRQVDAAVMVLERILELDPGNEKARDTLEEIRKMIEEASSTPPRRP